MFISVHVSLQNTCNNMNIKFYLDTRNGQEPYPLKLAISHKGKSALLPLNVSLNEKQWNLQKERIENHPNKIFLNNFIAQRKIEVQEIILSISAKKVQTMSATDLKNIVKDKLFNTDSTKTIGEVFNEVVATKGKSTADIYNSMRKQLIEFSKLALGMSFEDINNKFVLDFYDFLNKRVKLNTSAMYIGKFQRLFNYAIENEITENYPFKKLRLKHQETKKRDLTWEQLHYLFTNDFGKHQKAIDYFKLTFYLIGINQIDMYCLDGISNKNRIEYDRHKTGKHYSVYVYEEAREIIDKYGFQFGFDTFHKFYQTTRYSLREVGKCAEIQVPLTSYWARHSWASIASDLDFSKEVIAHGLGHGNNSVTDTYINYNIKKVDNANRVIIDYILGKPKPNS